MGRWRRQLPVETEEACLRLRAPAQRMDKGGPGCACRRAPGMVQAARRGNTGVEMLRRAHACRAADRAAAPHSPGASAGAPPDQQQGGAGPSVPWRLASTTSLTASSAGAEPLGDQASVRTRRALGVCGSSGATRWRDAPVAKLETRLRLVLHRRFPSWFSSQEHENLRCTAAAHTHTQVHGSSHGQAGACAGAAMAAAAAAGRSRPPSRSIWPILDRRPPVARQPNHCSRLDIRGRGGRDGCAARGLPLRTHAAFALSHPRVSSSSPPVPRPLTRTGARPCTLERPHPEHMSNPPAMLLALLALLAALGERALEQPPRHSAGPSRRCLRTRRPPPAAATSRPPPLLLLLLHP